MGLYVPGSLNGDMNQGQVILNMAFPNKPLGQGGIQPITSTSLAMNPLYNGQNIDLSGIKPVMSYTNQDFTQPSEEMKKKFPYLYGDALQQIFQKPLSVTNPTTQSENITHVPEITPQGSTTNSTWSKVGNAGQYLGQAGNVMTSAGAMSGNKGMYQAGVMTSGLGSAANSLKNIQSLKGLSGDALSAAKLGNAGSIAGAVGGLADSARQAFFSDQAANDSATTNTLNNVYDSISSSMMAFSPVGTIIGGAMKAGALVGDLAQSIGGGTDQMTTTDQIMDSSFFSWNVGLINGFGGSSTQKFGVNKDVLAAAGGDYGGSVGKIHEAAGLANKKYGLFSGGERRSADRKIDRARSFQNAMGRITDESRDQRLSAQSTQQLNATRYAQQINGDTDFYLNAKNGAKLARIRRIANKQKFLEEWTPTIISQETEVFKWGGVIEMEWEPVICEVEQLKAGGTIDIENSWEPTLYEDVEEFKKGGNIDNDIESLTSQKNVIPDGALHKNKHHIENTEGLTQKGIPVVDNEGEQQAEVEINEIIFSLEVTKKLEELYKSYSHYTTSNKEKDELAIEAGKLLVQEILFNTEDNTGLIDTLKNGGKINGTIE